VWLDFRFPLTCTADRGGLPEVACLAVAGVAHIGCCNVLAHGGAARIREAGVGAIDDAPINVCNATATRGHSETSAHSWCVLMPQ
jgi:hypothetical protein